ncbi:MAG: hypothetical protein OHK0046_19190 [Anaerolineae bacterium]
MDAKAQIARIQATITQQEQDITALEMQIAQIRAELDPFIARYQAATHSLFERIAAAREALNDLQALWRRRVRGLDDDVSVEELWRQSRPQTGPLKEPPFTPPPPEQIETRPRQNTSADLKQVYRKLARRYHPDLAQTEDERAQRTALMMTINEAYQRGDLEALLALLDDAPVDTTDLTSATAAYDVLLLRRLQQQSADLAAQIARLRNEQFELEHGEMMEFKLQESLARAQGRDWLKELTVNLQNEYQTLIHQVAQMRLNIEEE